LCSRECIVFVLTRLHFQDYYPAGGVKTNVLINDLDIELSNGTHAFYPIVTDTDGKYDRINNMEVIVLYNPMPNTTYTVTVTPHSVSVTQPYALIISGEVGEFAYSKKKDPLLVIIAAVLVLIFSGCVVLYIWDCCFRGHKKRKKKQQSVGVLPAVAVAGVGNNRHAPKAAEIQQPEAVRQNKGRMSSSSKADGKNRRSVSSGSRESKAGGGHRVKRMSVVAAESFEDTTPPDVLF
jgi:hypothetical protein